MRQRIEHEPDLIKQQLSWLVSPQIFPLSAFASSLNASGAFARPAHASFNPMRVGRLPAPARWLSAILRRAAAARSTEGLPSAHHRTHPLARLRRAGVHPGRFFRRLALASQLPSLT